MKFKKILLFILFFLLLIFINGSVVNGFTLEVSDSNGLTYFYLPELPSSASDCEHFFFYDDKTELVYCINVPENTNLSYYGTFVARFYLHGTSVFEYYTCKVDSTENGYVGGNWVYNSSSYLDISEDKGHITYIGGSVDCYPRY